MDFQEDIVYVPTGRLKLSKIYFLISVCNAAV